mmetsp:Transcript_40371/g.65285  ORF Transcript_40371/g.65285 Transcript_40371/m.65285 type:complete len:97 (-) Transcript_40371:540-830(-)
MRHWPLILVGRSPHSWTPLARADRPHDSGKQQLGGGLELDGARRDGQMLDAQKDEQMLDAQRGEQMLDVATAAAVAAAPGCSCDQMEPKASHSSLE